MTRKLLDLGLGGVLDEPGRYGHCSEQWAMPRASGLYMITDAESDNFYVGSTANFRERWTAHLFRLKHGCHGNRHLQRIWNANPSRLGFSVVFHTGAARLLAEEQRLLDLVFGARGCLNLIKKAGPGRGALGLTRSAETRRKISEALRGKSPSMETRELMRRAKLGRKLSIEHRAKLGAKARGRPGPTHTPENMAKWRKYSTAQVQSLRALRAAGAPVLTAAKEVGMSRDAARRILAGESYRGV